MYEQALCLRDGKDTLVISSGLAGCFHLPARCVVCNADAPRSARIRRTFRPRSIVAVTPVMSAAAGYDLELELSLCPEHARRRWLLLVASVLMMIAAIPIAASGGVILFLVGMALLIAGVVLAVRQYRVVRLVELDAVQAKIRVGEPFAQSFAEDLGGSV